MGTEGVTTWNIIENIPFEIIGASLIIGSITLISCFNNKLWEGPKQKKKGVMIIYGLHAKVGWDVMESELASWLNMTIFTCLLRNWNLK